MQDIYMYLTRQERRLEKLLFQIMDLIRWRECDCMRWDCVQK